MHLSKKLQSVLKLQVLASVPVCMHSKHSEIFLYLRPHEVLEVLFCWDLPEQITMRLVKFGVSLPLRG